MREPLLFQKKRDIFCAAGINDGYPTSEIGKLAVLTPAHGTLWQHAEHTEGSDATPTSHTQKALSAGRASCNFDKSKKRSRNPAGPRRLRNSVEMVTFGRYLRERFWKKSRTLQEGFSNGEDRSILVQDKERCPQFGPSQPQSPAVRGFPRF